MRILFFLAVCASTIALATEKNADEFAGLKCTDDPVKFLIGKASGNDRVVVIESRHKDLNLKDLGASGVAEDPYTLIEWSICGKEYAILIPHKGKQQGHITDVIQVPAHSKAEPEAEGPCVINGKSTADVLAILKADATSSEFPATKIWQIDTETFRFKEIPAKGIRCSKSGIVTDDVAS